MRTGPRKEANLGTGDPSNSPYGLLAARPPQTRLSDVRSGARYHPAQTSRWSLRVSRIGWVLRGRGRRFFASADSSLHERIDLPVEVGLDPGVGVDLA